MSAPTTEAERGAEEPRTIRQFKANLEFTGGNAMRYDPSPLCAEATHQALAKGQVRIERRSAPPPPRPAAGAYAGCCTAFRIRLGLVVASCGAYCASYMRSPVLAMTVIWGLI